MTLVSEVKGFQQGNMESQQIVELLLSMQARMDVNQERMETNRRADQEKTDADRQPERELLIGIMDANAKSMREDVKSGKEKMEAAIHSIRSEWKRPSNMK
jgi:hypothetical protein